MEISLFEGRRYLTFKVDEKDKGKEILSIMRNDLALSARRIKSVKYCEYGIFVNGKRENVRYRLSEGDILHVLIEDVSDSCSCLVETDIRPDVIYEDEDLLVVIKPSGLVCHPSQGHYADSLINAACTYLREKGEKSSLHITGRLDKDTSGLVCFSKSSYVQEKMESMRNEGSLHKKYIALVHGILPQKEGSHISYMKEISTEDGKHTVMTAASAEDGKKAETFYKVLAQKNDISLVSVVIGTGRTHQIRFHMAELGHPLLGDAFYGGKMIMGMERAALHALDLWFDHPVSGKELNFRAPVPKDMDNIIQTLSFDGFLP